MVSELSRTIKYYNLFIYQDAPPGRWRYLLTPNSIECGIKLSTASIKVSLNSILKQNISKGLDK